MPYSRSLAGVRGRLDGESECRESVGDIVGGECCGMCPLLSGVDGAGRFGVVTGL